MRKTVNRLPMVLAVTLAAALPAVAADTGSGKVYRWVDDQGVVHYGDRVPPQYSTKDRDVLNQQGVAIDREQGEITDAEKQAEAQARAAAEEARRQRAQATARDQVLLSTYLSVDEIESLRDQRTEMIDGQIQVTRLYLESLQTKLAKLQKDASRFRPYSPDPDAPPIHRNLAKELSNTLDSILLYEQTLEDALQRKSELQAKFAADISRFKELKGIQ